MAADIKEMFKDKLGTIKVEKAELTGTFDVFLGDDLIYSKKKTGRLPHPGEVEKIISTRIG